MIACVIHNVNCSKKSQMKGVKDFMLNFKPPERQSVDAMKQILDGMCNG